MPHQNRVSFFLGANSPDGFYSLFEELTDCEAVRDVYIIKGSAGSGKSSFMRKIAERLVRSGAGVEYELCSSDHRSLDGILCPKAGAAIVDGTSPHVCEPKYAGAREHYVSFSDFLDCPPLSKKLGEIQSASHEIHTNYESAYRFLQAARKVSDESFQLVIRHVDTARIRTRAAHLARRLLTGRGPGGGEKKRFLSAVSPEGVIFLESTVTALCPRIIELHDTYGLSPFFLLPIRDAALAAGFEVISCWCTQNPATKLEHLLIPALGLAFISTNRCITLSTQPERRIRLDAYLPPDDTRALRARLRLQTKCEEALLAEAFSALDRAKAGHDLLERLYNPHVDFPGVYRLADTLGEKIGLVL